MQMHADLVFCEAESGGDISVAQSFDFAHPDDVVLWRS